MDFIGSIIGGLFGLVGNGVKGFFGVKQAQVDVIGKALDTIAPLAQTDAAQYAAAASIISSEAKSGYWLAACIRPMLLLWCAVMVTFAWFGYMPAHFNDPMGPMTAELFRLIEIGFGGYIGGRSLEKIADTLARAGILKALAAKLVR